MTTKLAPVTPPTDLVEDEVRVKTEPVDWERAFVALASMTCTGFVQSTEVERWAQALHDRVDPRAAEVIVSVFNRTRSKWMQDFMG